MSRRSKGDIVVAGTTAAILGGIPSTVHAVATGGDPLEATAAIGTLVLPEDSDPFALIAVAVPIHFSLSYGWAAVMARVLPRRPSVLSGALFGGLIGLLDMQLIGRRFPRIAALPQGPQLWDHMAFGALVAWVLKRRS